jgi:hypothetical protein
MPTHHGGRPIANAANGHNYSVIRIANFDDHRIAAQNLGGYPIVINNASENDWVLANLMPQVPTVFTTDVPSTPVRISWGFGNALRCRGTVRLLVNSAAP